MILRLFFILLLFISVRVGTSLYIADTYYVYGSAAGQYSIAEAAYNGHWFSMDKFLASNVCNTAFRKNRPIPLEKWKDFPKSGIYSTFPATDLPGYGYLIAVTSSLFDNQLTSIYAYIVQVAIELFSLLLFSYCIYRTFGGKISFISLLLYILCYPFIWPVASQPMRDIFVLGTYASIIFAFYLFKERNDKLAWVGIVTMIAFASLLLWVRPTAYYYFFLAAPLAMFVKKRHISQRIAFAVTAVLLPIIIFNQPFKDFNLKHYGIEDTDLIGRTLWEGMGIIPGNKYGFKLDDTALVPWVKSQGYDFEYGSPQMNKVLGSYSRKVIYDDPGYYVRTVFVRIKQIVSRPLEIVLPITAPRLILRGYSLLFMYLSLFMLGVAFMKERNRRLELVLLTSPFFYTLSTQIPLHFEARYLATGAWVLILPLAWALNQIIERRKQQTCVE